MAATLQEILNSPAALRVGIKSYLGWKQKACAAVDHMTDAEVKAAVDAIARDDEPEEGEAD